MKKYMKEAAGAATAGGGLLAAGGVVAGASPGHTAIGAAMFGLPVALGAWLDADAKQPQRPKRRFPWRGRQQSQPPHECPDCTRTRRYHPVAGWFCPHCASDPSDKMDTLAIVADWARNYPSIDAEQAADCIDNFARVADALANPPRQISTPYGDVDERDAERLRLRNWRQHADRESFPRTTAQLRKLEAEQRARTEAKSPALTNRRQWRLAIERAQRRYEPERVAFYEACYQVSAPFPKHRWVEREVATLGSHVACRDCGTFQVDTNHDKPCNLPPISDDCPCGCGPRIADDRVDIDQAAERARYAAGLREQWDAAFRGTDRPGQVAWLAPGEVVLARKPERPCTDCEQVVSDHLLNPQYVCTGRCVTKLTHNPFIDL